MNIDNKTTKIVGIGANVMDTIITLDRFPDEDRKVMATGVKECGGGPCATGLVAAAKLGVTAAYIGALADDGAGRFLLADMQRFGMICDYVDTGVAGHSFASYVILSKEKTSRTCLCHKKDLPAFTLDENKKKAITDADILMVDGNELENAIEGAKYAHTVGTKVLYDAGGMYPGVDRLLPYADYLIPSEEFALGFTNSKTDREAAQKLYDSFHPEVVVITEGKRGGLLYDGKEFTPYPILPAVVVDSNGAGDVFHGAYAVAMTKGYDHKKACIFSSAVSALKCTKVGARDGVPGFDETIKFLKENGYNEF